MIWVESCHTLMGFRRKERYVFGERKRMHGWWMEREKTEKAWFLGKWTSEWINEPIELCQKTVVFDWFMGTTYGCQLGTLPAYKNSIGKFSPLILEVFECK